MESKKQREREPVESLCSAQVHGADQAPLPPLVHSFVACGQHKRATRPCSKMGNEGTPRDGE